MTDFGNVIIIILIGVLSFCIAMLISPLVIKLMARIKAGQPILEYLEHHSGKSGTPTMGGFIFVLPSLVVTVVLGLIWGFNSLTVIAALTVFAYCVLGFLDDFIKVRFKKNQGLKAYQKVIGQFGIAGIVTYFAYTSEFVGSSIRIPFSGLEFDIGVFFIPLIIILFIATTNSVNLTDGLDGLTASTGFLALLALVITGTLYYLEAVHFGMTAEANEYFSLTVFASTFAFGVLGFFWQNSNPAKIFMGDTGALSLGGAICIIAVFMRNPLIIGIIGITYILSSLSVMIQVVYFKLTKKRIFKMSPYHHHLELKGLSENKIVSIYTIITFIAVAIAIVSAILNLTISTD